MGHFELNKQKTSKTFVDQLPGVNHKVCVKRHFGQMFSESNFALHSFQCVGFHFHRPCSPNIAHLLNVMHADDLLSDSMYLSNRVLFSINMGHSIRVICLADYICAGCRKATKYICSRCHLDDVEQFSSISESLLLKLLVFLISSCDA